MSNGNKKNHSNFFYTGIRSTIWTASNIRPFFSVLVILQLRPTKFNFFSIILMEYYKYNLKFSKRLFFSLFLKKSGEFHDNKNYRVYVKKPHHLKSIGKLGNTITPISSLQSVGYFPNLYTIIYIT